MGRGRPHNGSAPPLPGGAVDLSGPQPLPISEQILFVGYMPPDVQSQRMPNGQEIRTLVIPVMGGQRVYLLPMDVLTATALGKKLMRGSDQVPEMGTNGAASPDET